MRMEKKSVWADGRAAIVLAGIGEVIARAASTQTSKTLVARGVRLRHWRVLFPPHVSISPAFGT